MTDWEWNLRQTLTYFDLWQYPLTASELYVFFPVSCPSFAEFRRLLNHNGPGEGVKEWGGYYFLDHRDAAIVERRRRGERHARLMWRIARLSMHVIKRFPFVRAVFVSGDLSKHVTNRSSDIDFFILTEPGRLWIARAFLILFKKVFLLNRKKFFCLNTFSSTSHLCFEEQNIYVAAEIATVKPLYNSSVFREFLAANPWIRNYFPNCDAGLLPLPECNERRSLFQRLIERPFAWLPSDRLDTFLMNGMKKIWAHRYGTPAAGVHAQSFLSTKYASRAYPNDVQESVLRRYAEHLRVFSPSPAESSAR
jgi:hypothetical protein